MVSPTLSAYNYMIAGYFKAGCSDESLGVFRKLAYFSDERPDAFTLSMVLKISGKELAREVHACIFKSELGMDEVLFSSLIDSYVKARMLGYARGVFDAMPERSLVSSTALIVGCMNESLFDDAEEIFGSVVEKDTVVFNAMIEGYSKTLETSVRSLDVYKEMRSLDFRPTVSSFVSVIGACCLLSALEFGEQVHGQIIKSNAFCSVKCGSALIDMYSKCGRIMDARRVFDGMVERNVVSWTSMIDGYGKNGIPQEALRLFSEMRRDSYVKPNYATFLCALSACGHSGLVSNGKEIFESMEKEFGLEPRMEHYACMVDLLGRAGSLDEAYKFIRKIPGKPNTDVWTAFLGASRLHGNVEMADVAAKEVFEMSGKGRPGAYVALSNTFAAAGRWEGVSEARELMKERGVSKSTAFSRVGTDHQSSS